MMSLAVWALVLLTGILPGGDRTAWPQWGGPARNFVPPGIDARDLTTSWPKEGPRRLWERPLGEGYSSIVTDGRTLYTLFRDKSADVAIALDAATGATVWESRYDAPFDETCSERLGPAPRAAPLIAGDRLITTSAGGLMNSFDRRAAARSTAAYRGPGRG